MRNKVFISYRNDETTEEAEQVYDYLSARFSGRVYWDRLTDLGEDFEERIANELAQCRVLIAILGPKWAGKPRAIDYARIEIEEAQRQPAILIIPLLVRGADETIFERLPLPLHGLRSRHFLKLNVERPSESLDKIVQRLQRALAPVHAEPGTPPAVAPMPAREQVAAAPPPSPRPSPPPSPARAPTAPAAQPQRSIEEGSAGRRRGPLIGALLVAAALTGGAAWWARQRDAAAVERLSLCQADAARIRDAISRARLAVARVERAALPADCAVSDTVRALDADLAAVQARAVTSARQASEAIAARRIGDARDNVAALASIDESHPDLVALRTALAAAEAVKPPPAPTSAPIAVASTSPTLPARARRPSVPVAAQPGAERKAVQQPSAACREIGNRIATMQDTDADHVYYRENCK